MPYSHAGVLCRGEFTNALRGLAICPKGRLHVAGDEHIAVFDASGRLERRWNTSGPAWSVAVNEKAQVFVGGQGHLQVFDAAGRLVTAWRHASRLGCVTAIGFAGDSVLAGDAVGRAIRRFDAEGAFLNDIGTANRMQGFHIPNGVIQFGVDADGTIHAANPGKHRVERYTPEGTLLGHIGRFDGNDPAGFGGCCNPTNVAVAGGRIYVTEKGEPRAKVYARDGRFGAVIASDLFDPNCKNMSIAVDPLGRVYVADTVRLVVHVFTEQSGRPS